MKSGSVLIVIRVILIREKLCRVSESKGKDYCVKWDRTAWGTRELQYSRVRSWFSNRIPFSCDNKIVNLTERVCMGECKMKFTNKTKLYIIVNYLGM